MARGLLWLSLTIAVAVAVCCVFTTAEPVKDAEYDVKRHDVADERKEYQKWRRGSEEEDCHPDNVNKRHEQSFSKVAGYLPAIEEVDKFHKWMHDTVLKQRKSLDSSSANGKREHVPQSESVQAFADAIHGDGLLRMYVVQMLAQVPSCRPFRLESVSELLEHLDYIITHVPRWGAKPVSFPMTGLFVYMMWTPAGETLFRNPKFQERLNHMQEEWCRLLDSSASVSVVNKTDGWLSDDAWKQLKLEQYHIDMSQTNGGFVSYNDFFHRAIKLELRPVASPHDPKVLTSSNDGTWIDSANGIKRESRFWAKGHPYSIDNILGPLADRYSDMFVGGEVLQSYLAGTDYHRYHAPISGLVREIVLIKGLTFSETESEGFDPNGVRQSVGYEAHVNTRLVMIIDSLDEKLGSVAMIPIGMGQVSSIRMTVVEGQYIHKGDEVGWFSYGGSSIVLMFQPNVVEKVHVKPNDQIKARQRIATLRHSGSKIPERTDKEKQDL